MHHAQREKDTKEYWLAHRSLRVLRSESSISTKEMRRDDCDVTAWLRQVSGISQSRLPEGWGNEYLHHRMAESFCLWLEVDKKNGTPGKKKKRQRCPFGILLKVKKYNYSDTIKWFPVFKSEEKRMWGKQYVGLDRVDATLWKPGRELVHVCRQWSRTRRTGDSENKKKALWLCSPSSVHGGALSSGLPCRSTILRCFTIQQLQIICQAVAAGPLPQSPRCRLRSQTGWAVTGPLLPESCGPISEPRPSAGGEKAPPRGPELRPHPDKQMGLKAGLLVRQNIKSWRERKGPGSHTSMMLTDGIRLLLLFLGNWVGGKEKER